MTVAEKNGAINVNWHAMTDAPACRNDLVRLSFGANDQPSASSPAAKVASSTSNIEACRFI